MRRVPIGPLDRFRCAVVMTDVPDELACEIADRGENAAGDNVTLDFGEPVLDLIEPGRVGRGEVQMHGGVRGEKFADPLGLRAYPTSRHTMRTAANCTRAR